MRKYVVAAVVCLAMLGGVAQAQMRGFGGGFRGGVSFGGPRPVVGTHRWGMTRNGFGGTRVFGFSNFGFSHFGRFPGICTPFAGCFRPAVFGVPFSGTRFFGHRSGFAGSFGFGTGFPVLGAYGYGYGMPYYMDASYDQDEYVQAQAADRQRMMDEVNFERRRDLEMQRQLAELQAAQEAGNAQQRAVQPAPPRPSAPETPSAPAVLVFRDGRQMQVDNYVMTSDRIFTLGPEQRQTIQLSELDLDATVKANQDRGVGFSVPKARAGK